MARAIAGQASSAAGRTPEELQRLKALMKEAESTGDLDVWRRTRAVLSYVEGTRVAEIATGLSVVRSVVNQWLRWFELAVTGSLRGTKALAPAPKLTHFSKLSSVSSPMPSLGPEVTGAGSGPDR